MPPTMPMSALLSALRGAGRQHLTASTVAAARQAVKGSHVLRLQGYNEVIRKMVPTGTAITSTGFHVGGQDCQIECYPNGKDEEHRGYTSLFLTAPRYEATTRFRLTMLGAAGKPMSCGRSRRASEGELCFNASSVGYRSGWKDFIKNDDLDLVDDCLTVLCDVTVDGLPLRAEEVTVDDLRPSHAEEVTVDDLPLRAEVVTTDPQEPEPTAAAPPPIELRDLGEVIWSKQPADVTVHAGGETFAAHRWVLEARSPVFKADLQKATSGELHIADMDAEVFKSLLYFIYTNEAQQFEEPTMAERVLAAADRYGLEKLKLACGETLCWRVEMGSVAAMLVLAERHGCAVLKDACMEFLSCPGKLRVFMWSDGYE